MKKVLREYYELARAEHLSNDFWVSLFLGIVISGLAYFSNATVATLVKGFEESISTIITAFSILAGFNTASLSVIATSDSPIIQRLRQENIEGTQRAKLEQILAYFSWSIVLHLILLLFAIIASLLYLYVLPIETLFKIPAFSVAIWIIITLTTIATVYSVKITIRNITILYDYLIACARHQ